MILIWSYILMDLLSAHFGIFTYDSLFFASCVFNVYFILLFNNSSVLQSQIVICIAGGIGITPFLSIILHLVWVKFTLIDVQTPSPLLRVMNPETKLHSRLFLTLIMSRSIFGFILNSISMNRYMWEPNIVHLCSFQNWTLEKYC